MKYISFANFEPVENWDIKNVFQIQKLFCAWWWGRELLGLGRELLGLGGELLGLGGELLGLGGEQKAGKKVGKKEAGNLGRDFLEMGKWNTSPWVMNSPWQTWKTVVSAL